MFATIVYLFKLTILLQISDRCTVLTAIGQQCTYRVKKDGMCGFHLSVNEEQPYRIEEKKLRDGLKAHRSIIKRKTHRLKRRRILIEKGMCVCVLCCVYACVLYYCVHGVLYCVCCLHVLYCACVRVRVCACDMCL